LVACSWIFCRAQNCAARRTELRGMLASAKHSGSRPAAVVEILMARTPCFHAARVAIPKCTG
jgi:hypothetical protein